MTTCRAPPFLAVRLRCAARDATASSFAMPPRGSGETAEAVEDVQSALATLPHAVAQLIFAQLPVRLRARCACVCRGWRDALVERSLWTRLCLPRRGRGASLTVSDALLHGAAARVGGELQTLDVSCCPGVAFQALLAVATANAGALRELRACAGACHTDPLALPLRLDGAEALLRAAPQLHVLDADVLCTSVADACRVLAAAEGLLAPLRAHGLRVDADAAATATVADWLALADDVAAHAWLQELRLTGVLLPPDVLDAFVEAALTRPLASALPPLRRHCAGAGAPARERRPRGGACVRRRCRNAAGRAHWRAAGGGPLARQQHADVLGALIRAPVGRRGRGGRAVGRFDEPQQPAGAVLAREQHADGIARRRWRAARRARRRKRSRAHRELDVAYCDLGDAMMRPLLEALAHNTHLRSLDCRRNDTSAAFARDELLPAVRANTGLRALKMAPADDWTARQVQQALLQRRT
jgi:hypothetical protein